MLKNLLKGYGVPLLIILIACIISRLIAYYSLQNFTDKIIANLIVAITLNALIFLNRRKMYKSYLFSAGVSMPLMLDLAMLV